MTNHQLRFPKAAAEIAAREPEPETFPKPQVLSNEQAMVEATNGTDPGPEIVPKPQVLSNEQAMMEATNGADPEPEPVSKPQLLYRCNKCRRIVATQETVVPHERGSGWGRRRPDTDSEKEPIECTSIFVEPMNWMEKVQEGYIGNKLLCLGCKARLGSFHWAGMQCNCGTWITPAFQLHKCRLDECHM